MNPIAGRSWARTGFWFGILTSVSGNVAHGYMRPDPVVGAILSSGFWPVALLISLEVIASVSWPRGRWWSVTRYGGLSTVALIAAIASYLHMSALLRFYGEDDLTSLLGPLAPDGLLVVCSVALLAIADNGRRQVDLPSVKPMYSDPAPIIAEMAPALQVAETITPAAETIIEEPPTETELVPPPKPEPARPLSVAEQAMQAYINSTHNGHELTSSELGALFQRSPRWGREQINKAKVSSS